MVCIYIEEPGISRHTWLFPFYHFHSHSFACSLVSPSSLAYSYQVKPFALQTRAFHSYALMLATDLQRPASDFIVAMNRKSSLIATFHRLIPLCSIYNKTQIAVLLNICRRKSMFLQYAFVHSLLQDRNEVLFSSFFFLLLPSLGISSTKGKKEWGRWTKGCCKRKKGCMRASPQIKLQFIANGLWTFTYFRRNAKYCNGIDITFAITTA